MNLTISALIQSTTYIYGLVWLIYLTQGFEDSMTWGLTVREKATLR